MLLVLAILAAAMGPALEGLEAAEARLRQTWPEETVLPNGVRLLVVPGPKDPPLASVQVWVAAGAVDEPDGLGGVAHFFEHMIFEGSAELAPGELNRRIEQVGGRVNAATSFDYTYYYATLPAEAVDEGIALLAEVTARPSFPADVLEREREVVLREIEFRNDTPRQLTVLRLFEALFDAGPYGSPLAGTPESVRSITREDMFRFLEDFYAPERITVVVAGAVDPARVVAVASEAFGRVPPRSPRPRRVDQPVRPAVPERRSVTVYRDFEQGHLAIGWPAPPAGSEGNDVYALDLAMTMLSSGRSSPFYRRIQREQGLVTSISGTYSTFRGAGVAYVYAQLPPEHAAAAEAAILAEVDRLRRGDFSPEELERARTRLLADYAFALEGNSAVARILGYYQTVEGDWRGAFRYPEAIRAVTPEDVQRVVREYLHPERYVRVYVGPQAEQETGAGPEPGAIVKFQFDNGHTFILKDVPHASTVAVQTFVRAGLPDEPPGKAGLSELTLRMLLKGAGGMSEDEFFAAVEDRGGRLSGASLPDVAYLTLLSLPEQLEELLPLYASAIADPLLDPRALEDEKAQVRRELSGRLDDFFTVAQEGLLAGLYGEHPYGRTSTDRLTALDGITLEDVRAFHRTYYVPNNLVTAVVGPIDIANLREHLSRVFGERSPGEVPSSPWPEDRQAAQRREVLVERQTEAGWLQLGFPAPGLYDERYPALKVLNAVLGTGRGSALFRELREAQGLVYTTGSWYPTRLGGSLLGVYAVTPPDPDAIERAAESMVEAVRRVVSETDEAALERARKLVLAEFVMARETVEQQAWHLAWFESLGVGYDMVERYPRLVAQVDLDTLQRVAREVLVPERAVRSLVAPPEQG